MHALRQDLRYAVRMLAKNPGFTAVAVVALALGIGANTAIFSMTDGLLARPVAYPNVDRVVAVYATPPNQPETRSWLSAADFADWRREATSFEVFAGNDTRDFTMTEGGEPARILGAVASPGMFEALATRPILGRTFLPEEEQPGRDGVVVLHYSLWQNRFASDPGVVGRTITLDGRPRTIVGVMGPGFEFPLAADLWVPFSVGPELAGDRTNPQVSAVARLKPGVTVEQAAGEMKAIAARLAEAYPDTNAGRGAYVIPVTDDIIDPYTRSLMMVLLAAVGLVLLIACANVSNLQLARATSRRREIAVRFALGASRWQIVRQLLVESVLLALAGCAAGIFLAQALVDLCKSSIPAAAVRYVPGLLEITLDLRMLGISLAIAALAGIVAGLLPALQASNADLGEAMKDASKGVAASRGSRRARAALVVSEIALTLALLVGSGLLVKHFVHLATTSNGYDPTNVLTMHITLPDQRYAEPRQIAAFYDDVVRRIGALPGVESASAVRYLPSEGRGPTMGLTIDGRPAPSPAEAPQTCYQVVTPSYFETLRVPLKEGRDFADADRADTMPVAIVNESAKRRFWHDEDPIGQRVKIAFSDGESAWLTIVGVVGDVKQTWIDRAASPTVHIPFSQRPRPSMYLTIRAADTAGITAAARAQVLAVDPEQPVFEIRTLKTAYDDSIAGIRLVTVLMVLFGAMALLLATVGVYGVMAYTVAQRRHEVGIRMALGARPADVLRAVVGQSLKLAAVGLAVGLPLAGLLGVGLSAALDGAIPFDPLSVAGFTALLCAIVALASVVPARRAARTDPADVLRSE